MSIPFDYPNPDQENVYYSIASLKIVLSNYFSQKEVNEICTPMSDILLPIFVFDDSSAPNSFLLTIFSKGSQPITKLINFAGKIVDSLETKEITPAKIENSLIDNATPVELDKSFHSTNSIRDSEFALELVIDEDQRKTQNDDPYEIELLLGTMYYHNPGLIENRLRYLEIVKGIVSDQLRNMPSAEYDLLVAKYKEIYTEVDEVSVLLANAKRGKKQSIDKLNFSIAAKETFNEKYDGEGLETTRLQIAHGISSICNVHGLAGHTHLPDKLVEKTVNKIVRNPVFTNLYQKSWVEFLENLKEQEKLEIEDHFIQEGRSIGSVDGDLGNLLRFTYNSKTKEVFRKNKSWLSEWYTDNLAKKAQGLDPNFDALDAYTEFFDSTYLNMKSKANLYALEGNGLLCYQAVLKAILILCQNNLNVSEYAPDFEIGSEKMSFFDKIGRNPILGPAGCHAHPRKQYSTEEGEPNLIKNYSKNGFLNLCSLIHLLKKVFSSKEATEYVLENMSEFNSDHDRVIQLWETICDKGPENIEVYRFKHGVDTKFVKSLCSLYKINEGWQDKKSKAESETLVNACGIGDYVLHAVERSFFNWHAPPCAAAVAGVVSDSKIIQAPEAFSFGTFETTGIISSSYDTSNLADYQRNMGIVKPNKKGTAKNKRTRRVHYGIWSEDKWSLVDMENGQSLEYFGPMSYSVPYFWASIMSLFKGLYVETIRGLIESVESITESEIDAKYEDLSSLLSPKSFLNMLTTVHENLDNFFDSKVSLFIGPNGCISISENPDRNIEKSFKKLYKIKYHNTTGTIAVSLANDYANFVSLISPSSKIQTVEEFEELEFDKSTYISPELYAIDSNPNFAANHGGTKNYIPDSFNSLYDVLKISHNEYRRSIPIKKNVLATNLPFDYVSPIPEFIREISTLAKYDKFLLETSASLQKFKAFIEEIYISPKITDLYEDNYFDITKHLENPTALLAQIDSNKLRYSPDYDGVSKYYKNIDLKEISLRKYKGRYIYILGLRENAWNGQKEVEIYPEFMDNNQEFGTRFNFTYYEPTPNELKEASIAERESKEILDYMHVIRGIHLNPTTFSEKNELVYEEHIIKNENGVFPWVEDDFKDGIPTKQLDSIFSISPYVFPRNFFFDTCLTNKFHRVVAVYITPDDLRSIGFEEEFIGSIRWRIGEKDD